MQNTYLKVLQSEDFKREYDQLLRDYVGRPSPLYLAHRLSEKYGCRIYLKREDLNHTGAHKINNSIGQVLLARRMGKRRIIAETGAGQHGVATATVCALMNMECIVYMGKTDVERQRVNVEKMKMLGATVVPVTSGNMTLKDATNEAIRDWCCHPSDTYYVIGSTVGPHPYPDMVARLQGNEITDNNHTEITGAEKSKLMPTDTGIVVNDFLIEYFPDILDYNFTASVEKQFDEIAEGDKQWTAILKTFYKKFPIVNKRSSYKLFPV